MLEYIKNNLIAFLALIVSISSFIISLKSHMKSLIRLKISYNLENSYSLGFLWYETYKLLIIDLVIENNSTSSVDISRIRLMDVNDTYMASIVDIADTYNENGISLIKNDDSSYIPINIVSENILNNTRISSYGTLRGFAVFSNIDPLKEPKTYKIIIDTPGRSFKKTITINPLVGEFNAIHPLKN